MGMCRRNKYVGVEIKRGKATKGAGIEEQAKRIPNSLSIKRKRMLY